MIINFNLLHIQQTCNYLAINIQRQLSWTPLNTPIIPRAEIRFISVECGETLNQPPDVLHSRLLFRDNGIWRRIYHPTEGEELSKWKFIDFRSAIFDSNLPLLCSAYYKRHDWNAAYYIYVCEYVVLIIRRFDKCFGGISKLISMAYKACDVFCFGWRLMCELWIIGDFLLVGILHQIFHSYIIWKYQIAIVKTSIA